MTKAYLRALLVLGPALFFLARLAAQPRPDVVIGAMAVHFNSERAEGWLQG